MPARTRSGSPTPREIAGRSTPCSETSRMMTTSTPPPSPKRRVAHRGTESQAPAAPRAGPDTAAGLPVPVVLAVAVAFAGAAYPVTGAALKLTGPATIATTRALAGGLVMLPILRLVGARLPRT